MTRTHDYQIISDTAPAIESKLATQAAEGWRPILMSTATINSAVQVFIVLEKPIPSPYAKKLSWRAFAVSSRLWKCSQATAAFIRHRTAWIS
jgi:hypothetical protein